MFNKIRFENKINIEMWGSFEILGSYVGERVNKIRYDGSINKEIRFRGCQYVRSVLGEKRRKGKRREETREATIFLQN